MIAINGVWYGVERGQEVATDSSSSTKNKKLEGKLNALVNLVTQLANKLNLIGDWIRNNAMIFIKRNFITLITQFFNA